MLHPVAIVASVVGLGLALTAYMMKGTGVDGTAGALLAVIGAAATLIGLLLVPSQRLGRTLHGLLGGLTVLASVLTALAAWFLMQDALTIAMAVASLVTLAVVLRPRPLRRF